MSKQADISLEARIAELEAALVEANAKAASAERGYASQIEALNASFEARLTNQQDEFARAFTEQRINFEQMLTQSIDEINDKHRAQIGELNDKHAKRIDELNEQHAKEVAKLKAEIANLFESLRRANQATFGRKSDRIDPKQLSLFNEVEFEVEDGVIPEEPTLENRPKKKRGGKRTINTANMERVVIEHKLVGDELICSQCGSELESIKYEVREVVKLVPAHFIVEEHRRYLYRCPECCKQNAEGEEVDSVMVRANMPAMPLGKSFASPSLLAYLLHGKYVNAMPLYRIEQEFESIDPNMALSRQLMASWVIQCYKRWFYRICERIKTKVLEGRLVHADETTVLVLKEPKRAPWKKSQMWVFASPCGLTPACLFEYHPSRGKDVVLDFFNGWTGTVMSDGLATYYNNAGIQNLSCLVHLRRGFKKVIDGLDEQGLAAQGSLAYSAVKLIDNIFAIDERFDDMGVEERASARDKELKPALEAFGSWLRDKRPEVLPGSKLANAFDECIRHWPDVMNVLKDGLFPLSNNLAERLIRPFAIGRKNWMFSDTQAGARASAAMYSIVATARGNGLIPRCYFEWLLEVMPNTDNLDDPAMLERLMPWAEGLPERLYADPKASRIAVDTPIIDIEPDALDGIDISIALPGEAEGKYDTET